MTVGIDSTPSQPGREGANEAPQNDHPLGPARIRIWDAPTRVFHWLLALSFVLAYVSGDEDRWVLLHVTMGYTVAGLMAWRLLWGVVGTRHARFADFVRGPVAAWRYLQSLLRGQPQHFQGHNPLGAVVIVAMLLLGLMVPLAGWAQLYGWPSPALAEAMEEVHELLANVWIALVAVHVAGVIVSGWLHRENLVRAMVTGFKRADAAADAALRGVRAWTPLGVVLLAAVLAFWGWRYSERATLTPDLQARMEQDDHGEAQGAARDNKRRDKHAGQRKDHDDD